jgi:hypothetical protein
MHAMFKTIKNMILKEKGRYDSEVVERLGSVGEGKGKKMTGVEGSKS